MKIIAHRGFSSLYPENTMLSFRKAVEIKADEIELDVHLSKDGEVMIIHDESLFRTTGVSGTVSDYTRAELEKISASKTTDDKYGFTPIPSLEEYLDFMKDHKDMKTNIELKTAPVYYPGIEKKTLALLEEFKMEENVYFSSFNALSIIQVKRLNPDIKAGLLFGGMVLHNMGSLISELQIEYYHPSFSILTDDVVKEMKENGVGINVWTVDKEEEIERCKSWNIDGLITNCPDKAIKMC